MPSSHLRNINLLLSLEGCPVVGSAAKRGKIVISTSSLLSSIWSDYKWLIRAKDFLQAGSSMLEESPHCPTQCMPFVRHHLPLFCIIHPAAAPGWIHLYSALTGTVRACSSNKNTQPLCYLGKESLLLHIYRALVLLCLIITEVLY